jgi:choline dehydrogenase-like flavoprotein
VNGDELRVHSVQGLQTVDASAMPGVLATHAMVAVHAVVERADNIIRKPTASAERSCSSRRRPIWGPLGKTTLEQW